MAEGVASVAPPRPNRQPAGPSINLTDKIIALQRKNANAPGPARASGRRAEADDFSRGGERQANRTLYDPSRPAPRPVSQPERRTNQAFLAPAISVSLSGGRERSARSATPSPNGLRDPFQSRDSGREPPRSPRSDRRNERDSSSTTKKLFNPDVHDPHHFSSSRTPPVVARNLHLGSDTSSVRPVIRRPAPTPLTPDEEADRERERRKRREGSERGSLSVKKKDGDARSRGSRSSDGSESLKDRARGKGKADSGVKAILKDIHNKIRVLETDLTEMHKKMSADPEAGIAVIMETRKKTEADETAAWIDLIGRHKELADLHQLFLVRVFDPMIPSTFQQLAVKYNIPSRLWQVSFHLILERLRHAWMTSSPHALDLLTDLVYDAYKFYTDLLEDQALGNFRTAWIEALGDLARYRMAIASFVGETSDQGASRQDQTPLETEPSDVARDFDAMSIGAEVAQSWDVEDKETWRTTAMDWYSMGITEKPGEGRLHHHLALLCRDVKGQEGRALHHFVKSLVVTHSYITSRESLLPLFDTALQSQRSLPDANAMDLFVRLHGMLFTRIDLDNFDEVLSRFMERLEEDAKVEEQTHRGPISQVDWITMASANLGAILQYGASGGVIRKALSMEGAERRRAVAQDEEAQDDEEEERETSPTPEERAPVEETLELPAMVTQALRLTVAILEHCFAHPTRQQGIHSVLNPYITVVLTFFGTVFKQQQVATLLSPYIPWQSLVGFVDQLSGEVKEESKLAVGPPLPEDWTVRGMEWVGRRVFERGFWKLKSNSRDGRGSGGLAQPRHGPSGSGEGERFASEMDVLLNNFENTLDISEGVVEEGENEVDGAVNVNHRRLRRVFWVIGLLVKHVDGLELREGKVVIDSPLKKQLELVERKKQAEAAERERELKSRYKKEDGEERRNPVRRTSLKLVPGYTMLVFDTNVLLSSLSLFASLVESRKWSIIIPLPVITELDGLSKNVGTDLSVSAVAAISYLEQKIKSHSLHLKIQTSKGNYLNDLLIRTEMVNFKDPELTSRNMDDLILNIATFQLDQFAEKADVAGGAKVLLVTYDRNLRVRSRARGIEAADEKEVSAALGEV